MRAKQRIVWKGAAGEVQLRFSEMLQVLHRLQSQARKLNRSMTTFKYVIVLLICQIQAWEEMLLKGYRGILYLSKCAQIKGNIVILKSHCSQNGTAFSTPYLLFALTPVKLRLILVFSFTAGPTCEGPESWPASHHHHNHLSSFH